MNEFDNPMRRQVFSLPDLIREQYKDLEPKTRVALTTPEIFSLQKIVLTGCGDSYAAAMGMKYAFENLTGLRTDVITAIELSRYYQRKNFGSSPNNPLVIAVSNSGQVARVGEAIERATRYGSLTLGVTGNSDSVLAKSCRKLISLNIPKFESAPGTRSYMVSAMVLLLIAIRIGEVRGRYTMDQAKLYRKDILKQADRLEALLPELDEKAFEVAKLWRDMECFDFIGAGPDYATAWFGHAKIYEAVGAYATHINTEEWLHLNFFMKNIDKIATTVVCSSDSPALSRAKETIKYASELTRPLAIITDGGKEDFEADAHYFIVPRSDYTYTGLLTQFAPICLYVGYIQAMKGEKSGRGCEGKWSIAKGARCVRSSEIVVL